MGKGTGVFQKAFAVKTGAIKLGELKPSSQQRVQKIADSMSADELKTYAAPKGRSQTPFAPSRKIRNTVGS